MTIDRRGLLTVSVQRTPVRPIIGAGAIAAAALLSVAAQTGDSGDLLLSARLGAIIVAASATTAVDDPSAALADAIWRGRLPRLTPVLGLSAIAAAVVWLIPAAIASSMVVSPGLPFGGLLVELVTLTILGWVCTAWIASTRGARGAPLAGAATLVVLALATMSFGRTIEWLWRTPDPDWIVSHVRWSLIGVVGVLLLAAAWREPA